MSIKTIFTTTILLPAIISGMFFGGSSHSRCEEESKRHPYQPVCCSDNKTYYNQQSAACNGKVIIIHFGQCQQHQQPDNDCDCKQQEIKTCECESNCPKEPEPVCGMDNKTYINPCVMQQHKVPMKCPGACESSGWGSSSTHIVNEGLPRWNTSVPQLYNESHSNCSQTLSCGCKNEQCKPTNRCCDTETKQCCMSDDGQCCLNNRKPPADVFLGPYWRNTNYHKGNNWKCNRGSNQCEPQLSVPYVLVKKSCARKKKKKVGCFLPPVPQCERFDFKRCKEEVPFCPGQFPDFNKICDCLSQSYRGRENRDGVSNLEIHQLLKQILSNQQSYSSHDQLPYETDFEVDANKFNQYGFGRETVRDCVRKIPIEQRKVIKKDPMVYYVFFFTLLKQNMCTENTEITNGYTVKDLLVFILEECWNLSFNNVHETNNNFPTKYDHRENRREESSFSSVDLLSKLREMGLNLDNFKSNTENKRPLIGSIN